MIRNLPKANNNLVRRHSSTTPHLLLSHLTKTDGKIDSMSTLADELLNDFEDSGSEGENESKDEVYHDDSSSALPESINGDARQSRSKSREQNGSMELDDDEEDVNEQDEDMADGEGANGDALGEAEDEEETKAKVEKMQLGGVRDVRSVAGLMKTLEPVLQVGPPVLLL